MIRLLRDTWIEARPVSGFVLVVRGRALTVAWGPSWGVEH